MRVKALNPDLPRREIARGHRIAHRYIRFAIEKGYLARGLQQHIAGNPEKNEKKLDKPVADLFKRFPPADKRLTLLCISKTT